MSGEHASTPTTTREHQDGARPIRLWTKGGFPSE